MSSVVPASVILRLVASGRRYPADRSTIRKPYSRDSKNFNVPIEIYEELQDMSVPSEI
jgi:hypothetical protein